MFYKCISVSLSVSLDFLDQTPVNSRGQELGARRLGLTALEAHLAELRGAELREAQQLQREKQRLQEEQRRLQQLNTQVGRSGGKPVANRWVRGWGEMGFVGSVFLFEKLFLMV